MPPLKRKLDNRSLATKVDLRKRVLAWMGLTDHVTVLDVCAGYGHVWSEMEKHVTIKSWIKCDMKPKVIGTLDLTAVQSMRNLPLDAFNVIDIDTYGEPWEPYLELLTRLRHPTAVFLTRGHVGVGSISIKTILAAGIPRDWHPDLPRTPTFSEFVGGIILSKTYQYCDIPYALTIDPPNGRNPSVTCYGLALHPHTHPPSDTDTPTDTATHPPAIGR